MKTFQVAVLGGGASGALTAILASEKYRGEDIAIIEGGERLMRKLAQTGNGRGNISNIDLSPQKFFGDDCFSFIEKFNLQNTLDFFATLGIATTTIENKIFPRSLSASSFVDILRFTIQAKNITTLLSHQVEYVKKSGDLFVVSTSQGAIKAKKIVVAMGGAAAPHLNTNGGGVKLLRSLGHSSTKTFPALVQLKTTSNHTKTLKGIKTQVSASFVANSKTIATATGEMHFSEFALSGPVSFILSTHSAPFKNGEILVDFIPETSKANLQAMLLSKSATLPSHEAEVLLFTILPNQIARAIIKDCALTGKKISDLSQRDINAIAEKIKNFSFDFAGNLSFSKAQSTLGGVPLAEFDSNLQSKIRPNLFATGEVLNVCGECGGYNLQWAWSSAFAVSQGL